jgi:poly(hydroxyalkanoate) depolymerase family esterase
VLLMPGQVAANNRQGCFNWFRPGDTGRGLGEAGSIQAMVNAVLAKHRCDRSRVYVTGLSAGAAMATCLLAAYPDMFAAGGIVAGLPAGSAHGVVGAMTRMAGRGAELSAAEWLTRARALAPVAYAGPWPRLSVWRGASDTVVAPINGAQIALQWAALHGLEAGSPVHLVKPGISFQTWGKTTKTPTVELWTMAGVGHTYPTRSAQGFSACDQIARFWGLPKC